METATQTPSLAQRLLSWKLYISFSIILIAITFILQAYCQYKPANYSAAFASAAQLLGASLAILISAFLVASQIVEGISPLALRFLPKAAILGILIFESLVVGLDLLILLFLPDSVNKWTFLVLNVGAVINLTAVIAVIPYGLVVVDWIRIESLLENSISWARKKTGSGDRLEVLQILEELALRSAERRQAHTCSKVIEACYELSSIFTSSGDRDIEVIKKNPDHPVREIQELLGRIGELCSDFHIEDAIPQIAWVYRDMANKFDDAGLAEMLDVEFSGGIRRINEACVKNRQEWTIYNLWANLEYVIKEWIKSGITQRSRILLYTIGALEESLVDCSKAEMYNASYQMLEAVESIVLLCKEVGYPKQTKHGVHTVNIDLKADFLELLQAVEQLSNASPLLNFKGRFGERRISEIISSIKQLLN